MKTYELDFRKGTLIDSVSKTQATLVQGTGGFNKNCKGYGMNFDGVSTYIDTNVASNQALGSNCTIECWMKIDDFVTTGYIFGSTKSASATFMSLVMRFADLRVYYSDSTGTVDVSKVYYPIVKKKFYHVLAIRKNTNEIYLYVDGALVSSAIDGGSSPDSNEMVIGRSVAGVTSLVKSTDSLVRTYNHAFTNAEINKSYNEFLNSHGIEKQQRNFSYPKPTDLSKEVDSKIGSNIVVNGGFNTDTDWIKTGGVIIDNGKAVFSAIGSGFYIGQNTLTIGKKYRIIYTISDYVSGGIYLKAGSGTVGTTRSANGTHTEDLICSGSQLIGLFASASTTAKVDNVTATEITGLVAAYNFSPKTVSVGKVIDISGNGNNGTIVGGVVNTKDGLDFNGTNGYISGNETLQTESSSLNKTLLVCFKHKTGSVVTNERLGIQLAKTNSSTAFGIFARGANQNIAGIYASPSATLSIDSGVILNKNINTAALVQEGTSVKLYVNGVLTASANDAGVATYTSPFNFTIGTNPSASTDFLDGTLIDSKFYTKSFTVDEVKAYHNSFVKPVYLNDFSDYAVGETI